MSVTTTLGLSRHALAARLAAAGIGDADHNARALMRSVTGLDAAGQAAAPERALTVEETARLEALAARRMAGEPLQHLTGHADFWTLRLKCDARALVPRADTETVVETALKLLPADRETRVLDLGVGSGAILLAILSERPRAAGFGVDLSKDALSLARENAALTGLSDRVTVSEGDWDSALRIVAENGAPFDLAASNPPYIRRGDIAGLSREVRRDPHDALDGGPDGLDAYRAILKLLPRLLAPGAPAVLEIGADQAGEVAHLAESVPGLEFRGAEPDLEGRPRAAIFRRVP